MMNFHSLLQISDTDVRLESLAQAALIFIIAIVIVISNIILLTSYINYKGTLEVINYYFLSLSVADLLCGMFIVPLSVYPALTGRWMYGDVVCRIMGYLEVTLWSVTVYTFMWISVDRYLAVRKPLRYETVQTKTRCQCWMAFTWISAAMLCCPPLLGHNAPLFDKDSYICMLDWGNMTAYTTTLIILVLGPSVISIVYNYVYIFSMVRKVKSGEMLHDKEYITALSETLSNPNHLLSFLLIIMFLFSWSPFIAIRVYELISGMSVQNPLLHFGLLWFGILNSFWKFVAMFLISPNFRLTLKIFCLTICCKPKQRLQIELLGMNDD